MSTYLLSVHTVEGENGDPQSPEEMESFMERVMTLEREMQLLGLGLPTEAAAAFMRGAEIAPTDRDRRFLVQQATELEEPYSPG